MRKPFFTTDADGLVCDDKRYVGVPVRNYGSSGEKATMIFKDLTFKEDGEVRGWTFYSFRDDVAFYADVFRRIRLGRYVKIGSSRIQPQVGVGTVLLEEKDYIKVNK